MIHYLFEICHLFWGNNLYVKDIETVTETCIHGWKTKRKTHFVNTPMQNLNNKNDNFWSIFADVFLTFSPGTDCGYSLELPRRVTIIFVFEQ